MDSSLSDCTGEPNHSDAERRAVEKALDVTNAGKDNISVAGFQHSCLSAVVSPSLALFFSLFAETCDPIRFPSVLRVMSAIQATQPAISARLRAAYDEAFAMWVKQVTILQRISADQNTSAGTIERAKFQCRLAELAYRETRDRLWRCLAASDGHDPPLRAAS
jgi:hypothetical protein